MDNIKTDKIRAADKITILYQLFIIILILFNYKSIAYSPLWIFLHILTIIYLLKIPDMQTINILNQINFWNPIFILLFNFCELHYLVHSVNTKDLDNLLIQFDYQIFGVHPTIWLEKYTYPFITEIFQFIYSIFYFLPIILIILLLKNKNKEKANFFIFVMVYGFYISYIGYFLVPAIGPRFTLDHMQSFPIQGVMLTEFLRNLLDLLENIQRDAFPSGHVEMTLLTMYYAFKFNKKYFIVLLFIGNTLILSTVYLRYHYVVDIIGGIIFALFVILTADLIYKKLKPLNY